MEHVILLDAHGLGIWRHAGNLAELELRLDAAGTDDRAVARLRDWLGRARRRCTLVADVADERHAVERLPRSSRADRRQLIRLRLAQRFPDTALTSAAPLPASPEDGLFEPVRLAALTRPALIEPWLEVLGEAGAQGGIALHGLTSVPFLLERWYRRQRAMPARCLLLTLGAGGMRHAFFRQRRLAFSRVIPAKADTLAECLPDYRDELAQTLAWLASQRLADGPQPIRVLAKADELPILRELAMDTDAATEGDIVFIDLAELAPSPGANKGVGGDVLSLALQETRRGGALGRYDCPRFQPSRRLARARRAMVVVTAAVAAAGLGAAAVDFVAIQGLRHEAGQFAARQRALQGELDKLNADAAREPLPDALTAWLDEAERLADTAGIAPAFVLQSVAAFLDEMPWARLEALAWKSAQDEDTTGIALEIALALTDGAPPPKSAADMLVAHWLRQHGAPMQAHIDAARLRLHTTFTPTLTHSTPPLPPRRGGGGGPTLTRTTPPKEETP